MYHLVYTSHATHPFSESDLIALLKESRHFNRRHDITGMLLYIQGKFIQVLEGEKETVLELYGRIVTDSRHHRASVIVEGESGKRIFKDWSMGFRRITEQEALHLGGFRNIDQFFSRTRITEESNLLLVFLRLFYNKNMVEFAEV